MQPGMASTELPQLYNRVKSQETRIEKDQDFNEVESIDWSFGGKIVDIYFTFVF